MSKRHKTDYPGVFYREAKRIGGKGDEKVYYVVFKRDGKTFEEKVGRQYANRMTPAKASRRRSDFIEGKTLTKKEQAAIDAGRWGMERLWQFFAEHKGALKSFRDDKSRWKNHIRPALGSKLVDDLVTLDVDRIKLKMLKTHSPQTVKHVMTLIKRMIRFGVEKGQFPLPDKSRLNFKMPTVQNEKDDHLSTDQVKRLLKVLDTDPDQSVASMLKLALYTGMRKGELFGLKWQDVDFEKGFIRLPDPKGGKPTSIPLNALAREVLEKTPRFKSEYVFASPTTGKKRSEARRPIRRIKKAAGIPDSIRPMHSLRHTYATLLASSGKVDIYLLQRLLTHKSGQMTQRYADLVDDALKRAANDTVEVFNEVTGSVSGEKVVNLDDHRE